MWFLKVSFSKGKCSCYKHNNKLIVVRNSVFTLSDSYPLQLKMVDKIGIVKSYLVPPKFSP